MTLIAKSKGQHTAGATVPRHCKRNRRRWCARNWRLSAPHG